MCLCPFCHQSVRQHTGMDISKPEVYPFVCVCHLRLSAKRLVHVLYLTHAAPRLTHPLFSPFPAAFKTLLEARRSGCSQWFDCPRGRLHQTESALGLLNRQQSSPCCQTQWLKCFWLCYTPGVRGRLHDSVNPATKTWLIHSGKLLALTRMEFSFHHL